MPKRIPYAEWKAQEAKRSRSGPPAGYAATQWKSRQARSGYKAKKSTKSIMRTGGYTGVERKFIDTFLTFSTLSSASAWTGAERDPVTDLCLNPIAQGDGEEQRDGRKCVMKSVFVQGVLHQPTQQGETAPSSATAIFIALVLDTQTNGVQMSSENVYVNPMGTAFGVATPLRNLQFTSRFKVLDTFMTSWDTPNMVAHDSATAFDIGGRDKIFKLSKTLDIPVSFTGATGNISTIQDNSLHLVAISTVTGPGIGISYNSRVRFVSP